MSKNIVTTNVTTSLLTPSKITHYLNVSETSCLRALELPEKLGKEGDIPQFVQDALKKASDAQEEVVKAMTLWRATREAEMAAARAAKKATPVTSAPEPVVTTLTGPEGPPV